ncbi:MAG: ABC transporter ATP-binding protein [Acidobacteriota bacterium]|jgi:iron complex transport system ATP-binding protein|nr:ABC transporter ATP-binding protein [Acidobacteriota bacterium]
MALIEISHLSFGYRRAPVIEDLDLSIEGEGVTALLGPNGSGKTTLLKLLLGLLAPTAGRIRIGGDDIGDLTQKELACRLAYVPQVHKETFGYSVFDVVLMGRMPRTSFFARYGDADRGAAREALDKLSIAHLADRPYTEISGGERQMTLIARALAQGADIFVMDEPTNGLDYGNQLRLLDRIGRLAAEGYTFIYTTHHPDHALAVADRVVMMKDGRVVREGAPQAVLTTQGLAELYNLSDRLCTCFGAPSRTPLRAAL